MSSKMSQDHILNSFYEQRKSRGKTAKRHSLLQKNLSYFSNIDQQKQNNSLNNTSQKNSNCNRRKNNLKLYQQNLKQITEDLQKMRKVQSCSNKKNNLFQNKPFYEPLYLKPQDLVKQESQRSPEFKKELLKQQNSEEYFSPKFNSNNEFQSEFKIDNQRQANIKQLERQIEIGTNIGHNYSKLGLQYEKSNTNKQYNSVDQKEFIQYRKSMNHNDSQIQFLKERIQTLQKVNKKQEKFIQSVQKMRKTIENVSDDCSLKQLWRWLKSLPTSKYE